VALLLPLVMLPVAQELHRDFVACPPGLAFNEVLFRTFRLELWFAALLSAGALLGRITG
jgi:1,4-dihydroxy-2-naphthoate octaprenyltransferase